MCTFTPSAQHDQDHRPYAIAHVSPDCDPATREALRELVDTVAAQHGYGSVDVNFVVRDEDRRLAEYLGDTEVFDG